MGLKQRYDIYQLKDNGYDAFNTPLYSEELYKTIEMIVVPKDYKIVVEGAYFIESKYLGLTSDKTLKRGMKVKAKSNDDIYEVEHVNNIARLAQIKLKRCDYDE